jgi:hypothetical protein
MTFTKSRSLVYGFIICLSIVSLIKSELRFAIEMFRHGARSPVVLSSNKTDIFGEKWDSQGELTSLGMRQHYLLGYKNRVFFKDFLSSSYDQNEIYVVSTDVNRTLMSAQSHLQGLYPPGTGPEINPSWSNKAVPPIKDFDFLPEIAKLSNSALPNSMQVFPIHQFDYSNKFYFLYDQKFCPRTAQIFNQRKIGPKENANGEKFAALYGDKIKKALNLPEETKFNYDFIQVISDSFISGYTEGRNFTSLKNAGIDIDEFANFTIEHLSLDVLDVYSGDKEFAIATKSTAFRDINRWMSTRVKRDSENKGYTAYSAPKLVLYSFHDRDLGDMFGYLREVFNMTEAYYPFFASSMLFELHRRDNVTSTNSSIDDYYVKVSFNDKLLMNITYSQFDSSVLNKSYTPQQIGDYCGWVNPTPGPVDPKSFNYFMITTLILGVIAILELIFIIYQRKKMSSIPLLDNSGNVYNNV